MADKGAVEIFTVACQVCGSYTAGHVIHSTPEVWADIGASTVDALRAGRKVGITTGPVQIGGCTKDCPPTGQDDEVEDESDGKDQL